MKRVLFLFAVLVCLAGNAKAQGTQIQPLAADPATCTAGAEYFNTTSNTLKVCGPANTWASAGGISSVATLPACASATGTIISLKGANGVAYGDFYCGGIGPIAQVPGNPGQTVSPLSYGALADGKFIYDAQFNGTTTVTCPNSDCGFTTNLDANKIEFGTTATESVSATAPGSLVVPQGTIVTVNSANNITVSITANASCTPAGVTFCGFAWGTQDDATAIQSAVTAAWGTQNGVCKGVQLPSGVMFIGSAVLQIALASLNQACGGTGQGSISGQDTNQVGPEVFGEGPANSVLMPLPGFNFASCGFSGAVCIGGTPNMEVHDLGVNGLGQGLTGTHNNILFDLPGGNGCSGSTGFNLSLSYWAYISTGTSGLRMGASACGDATYENIVVEQFGQIPCVLPPPTTVEVIVGLACFGATGGQGALEFTGGTCGGIINTFGGYYAGVQTAGMVVWINTSCGFTWNSSGEFMYAQFAQSQANVIQLQTGSCGSAGGNAQPAGCTVNMTGDQLILNNGNSGTSSIFILQAATANFYLLNNLIVAAGTNNRVFSTSAGTNIYSTGGNRVTQGTVTNTINAATILMINPTDTWSGLSGMQPTCAATTGGTACSVLAGSTNEKGTVRITASAVATGTVTITFAGTFSGPTGSSPTGAFNYVNSGGTGAWSLTTTTPIVLTTRSSTVPVINWNQTAALTGGSTYDIDYTFTAK